MIEMIFLVVNCNYVVFQLYVGGNAALIGQKLATYPDLMVQHHHYIVGTLIIIWIQGLK